MSEYSENDVTMTENDEIAVEKTAEADVVSADVTAEVEAEEPVAETVVESEADVEKEEDAEDSKIAPENLDDELFDKVNRAARLLRGRRDMMREEAEEDAKRMNDLMRALKLLELKPRMEQKEMAELMGMRLRELDGILAEAEKNDIVARIEPEEEDMRKIVVIASEDAEELIAALGNKRKKLVPQLSAATAESLIEMLDQVIEPLVAMGLDSDRGPRGGFGGRDDRGPRGGFGGGRGGDRGPRGNFGPRGGRGGRDDRGGRGGFSGNHRGGRF